MTKTIRQSTHSKKCLKTQAYQGAKRTAMRSSPEDPVFKTKLQNRKSSICKHVVKPSTTNERLFTEDFGFKESVMFNDDDIESWCSGFYDAYDNYYGDLSSECDVTTYGYDLHYMSGSVYVSRSLDDVWHFE